MLMLSPTLNAQHSEKEKILSQDKNQKFHNNRKNTPSYSFTLKSTMWDFLSNPTILTNSVWDDPEFSIPIDFDFYLFGQKIDSLSFREGLGSDLVGIDSAGNQTEFYIVPFGVDIIDRSYNSGQSSSIISYKTIGSAGNQILQIEWKNVGFYGELDSLGTADSYSNFQMWIFEEDSRIEMVYGPSLITNPTLAFESYTGPIIGVVDNDAMNYYLLSGMAANPSLVNSLSYLVGVPNTGVVYEFSPVITSIIEEIDLSDLKFSPNPVSDELFFDLNINNTSDYSLRIYNSVGQIVFKSNYLSSNQFSVDVSDWDAGIFYVELLSKATSQKVSRKIIKL